jgi:3-oxoacyl-[acyl-carrier-protein] synthase III
MTAPIEVNPHLTAVASELPPSVWPTEELLAAGRDHLSDKLVSMFRNLGVDTRYSILANYGDVLYSGAEPELGITAAELAVNAARKCLAKADVPTESIGLVLGVTSSPGRLLPSLVCDVVAQMPELSRSVATLSISYMGCSAIAKVVETARWFLSCRPDQRVLVCFMDAITPLTPTLPGFYSHFSEISPEQRQETVNALHGFLFGDASVAMLFAADGPGPSFGPVVNLTNERAQDAELGTVPDGGSDIPVVNGRRLYTLSPEVTPRGAFYAGQTVRTLLEREDCELSDVRKASVVLLHTGSVRILDGLCEEFGLDKDSDVVASSYGVLRDHGNTIGCSVPLMLAEPVHRPEGHALLVAFGLSFSCGSFTMTVPAGGWSP